MNRCVCCGLVQIVACMAVMQSHVFAQIDPFAGDDRLVARHPLRVVGQPLREVLAGLTQKTGIPLTASAAVAEDKVVLFVQDRPLGQTLNVLARFFRFTWLRDGKPGEYTYTLTQTIRQKRAEDEEREKELFRTADQIVTECALYRSFVGKTPEELKAIRTEAEAVMRSDTRPEARHEAGTRAIVSLVVATNNLQRMGLSLLSRLNRDEIVALLREPRTEFAWPAAEGARPIASDVRREILETFEEDDRRRSDKFPEGFVYNHLSIRILADQGRRNGLSVVLSGRHITPKSNTGRESQFRAPLMGLPPQDDVPIEPPDWRKIDKLNRPVTFSLRPTRRTEPPKRLPLPPAPPAGALDALCESQPIDLISDAFYSVRPFETTVAQQAVGAVLTRVARSCDHTWSYADGFVLFRSRRYAIDRFEEPPVSRLRRWSQMDTDAFYSLDNLGKIAAQPTPGYLTTLRVLFETGALEDRTLSRGARSHLVFWNALSPGQRSAAASARGLSYHSLPANLRQMFYLASLERLATEERTTKVEERPWPQEELQNARLFVTSVETTNWGYRSENTTFMFGGGSREQALTSLQGNFPGTILEEVLQVKQKSFRFEYKTPAGATRTGVVNMARKWSKPD
jgi:hypothetical protein